MKDGARVEPSNPYIYVEDLTNPPWFVESKHEWRLIILSLSWCNMELEWACTVFEMGITPKLGTPFEDYRMDGPYDHMDKVTWQGVNGKCSKRGV